MQKEAVNIILKKKKGKKEEIDGETKNDTNVIENDIVENRI